MLPHFHFLLGILLADILRALGINGTKPLLIFLGSIGPDFDYLITFIKANKNHRTYFTHYPFTYMSFILLFLIFRSNWIWFFWGALLHVLFDTIDWEVLIFAPFLPKKFSFLDLDPTIFKDNNNIKDFLLNYYSNKVILIIEAILLIIVASSVLLI
ncbi:metal-dependent hydrolase [Candidatus Hodarchaeum mangrovi]